MRSESKHYVANAIAGMEKEIIELLQSLVRCKTVVPPGNYEAVVLLLQDWLTKHGVEVTLVTAPSEAVAKIRAVGPRTNLLARIGSRRRGPSVWLNGHLDTVPDICVPDDAVAWRTDPFEAVLKDGRVWGRGACDCKGRLTSYAACIAGLARSGVKLNGEVVLAATCDEETCDSAYTGAGYLKDAGILKADYAIIEGMSDEISFANCGEVVLQLHTTGAHQHTSQVQEQGPGAADAMVLVLARLLAWGMKLPPPAPPIEEILRSIVTVEAIKSLGSAGMADPQCTATVNVVPSQGLEIEEILDSVRAIIDEVISGLAGVTCGLEVLGTVPPAHGSPHSRIAKYLADAAEELTSIRPPVKGLSGRTDLFHFLSAGADAVNYGPGRLFESNLHMPNENVRISDLVQTAQVCATAILQLFEEHLREPVVEAR